MTLRLTAAGAALLSMTALALAQSQPAPKPAQPAPAGQAAKPPAAPQGDVTPPLSGPQPDWVKACQSDPQAKKQICQISRDLRSDTGQTLASVAIREAQGGKRAIVLAIPPGMQIQPGVRVFVDKTQALTAKFSVCMQSACFVEAELPDATLATLRKGTLLTLQAINVQGRGVQLPFQLAGFGKAYDGAPIDPKAIADSQKKLQQELIERANKARAEQDGAAGAANPQ